MKAIVSLDKSVPQKMANTHSALTMSRWPIDDLPHQKLINHGPSSLTDTELLALVLSTGTKGRSAMCIAREILANASYSLCELARFDVRQFKKIKGIGNVKAAGLAAVMELGRRRQAGYLLPKKTIRTSSDAALYFKPILADQYYESFYVLYLTCLKRVLKVSAVGRGGMNSVLADIRIILREALELGATKIILCHNHPSGNLTPSVADKIFTNKISKAAKTMDIEIMDHLIVSNVGFYSFADEGLLEICYN